MGIILDTSTLVSAERRRHGVREIFAQIRENHGEISVGLSAVTVVELAHGIERAKVDVHRERRQAFLDDLIAGLNRLPGYGRNRRTCRKDIRSASRPRNRNTFRRSANRSDCATLRL
jgi:predicted nucleic acid-binding protein